ncbi:hypothetical protein [Halorubrum sp. Ea8]|uniref:hypothetical protein n=1 Tax=Halorubrum sp. Ea8 TaxID=1383841 RepID=UPI000B9955E5|nr:hypothetical protein [Halorubrum sp. Ea8]OYR50817.1 hypothetical protein DJ74_05140 [Halorubrum sp. Ea8]
MNPRRWTPFTFVVPARYVDRDDWWEEFDLEAWSRSEYDWTQDAWNALRDFARCPRGCVEAGRGDCEEYALVALSWAIARDREGVGYDPERGMERLESSLEKADIEYESRSIEAGSDGH